MDFYTLAYITQHQAANSTARVVAIIVALALVLLGVQLEQYSLLSRKTSQSQRLVDFIQGVALDQGVSEDTVLVSSTSLADGMIVLLVWSLVVIVVRLAGEVVHGALHVVRYPR